MPVFNQSRKNVVAAVFIAMFLVVILQLMNLQLFSPEFKIQAANQGRFRKVIYPDRGVVYDRKGRPLIDNTVVYDLMVTPSQLRGIDTALLCNILNVDSASFMKTIVECIVKNGRARPSIFKAMLDDNLMAILNESLYKFAPAFYLQERSMRKYPFETAANLVGYTAEVDSKYLRRHVNEGYVPGDYAGMTGLEASYEKLLMGQRGIEFWKRDNKNRLTDRIDNGRFDTAAIPGKSLYTSLDIDLQMLGEKLMQNKIGSIVAIDPKTGGILAMVSAPNFKPSILSGAQRRKNYSSLYLDPALPLLNRTVSATYSPGSTFKTLQGIIGLNEGVINTNFTLTCRGAYYGCGHARPMRCLDYGTFDFRNAIRLSDNTYFATVMEKVLANNKYPNIDSSLNRWAAYMHSFGLGRRLGVDVPSEKKGLIPDAEFYNERYGKGKWNYCTFRSVSIGQGEVDVTPLQVANEMAFIANHGYYYTPHVVDSIEGGDKDGILKPFSVKNDANHLQDSIFNSIHDGMQMVVDGGTGTGARVKGIAICGKTGTVENYFRGVKQPNHAFFCGFAPRENPKIAIMCVVENSGRFGGTYAAPIVGFMIEKYLNDSITDKGRLAALERMANLNLMPARIDIQRRSQDSARHAKDTAYLIEKGYIKMVKDTLETEDEPDKEPTAQQLAKAKKELEDQKKREEDSLKKINTEAVLPPKEDEIKAETDTVGN